MQKKIRKTDVWLAAATFQQLKTIVNGSTDMVLRERDLNSGCTPFGEL
jgi:hypothetical protein